MEILTTYFLNVFFHSLWCGVLKWLGYQIDARLHAMQFCNCYFFGKYIQKKFFAFFQQQDHKHHTISSNLVGLLLDNLKRKK
jgi:hypothetical protein